ncbi:tRNA 2-thiouridine(34) synthase MnmA [Faecalitalea cylindroides]|uniref:tRNA 2-thiouridine(34) synthase MnmA n=1 Tax=Faecalitalea cylindroides TaxID=39483 RepID=UPI00232C20A4|nr:tRNA 2-thiouridine(34) synthase MnmA [Faecalitalea cylindroides]MDB7952630.1 tRNA 2-thiouridine(34) synthase MnmA [Faecalitalea cylindroides]MDB7959286.1 tRNA 2-thiouridine(34) synthase MnmA [Faecalitalea cylindroides]MDB7961351.1 tRNA 2-thiouridine(34) synthase MnmA [Faecalitalea cylindroides]MDB7963384.1 tRNA 2-thiouridine(34) synthase MnmA [Faecalitalea cylindroides]MDB7964999.1 tRNA 2-thiouridine(34) synthase MnmA [Faecalitalea cylindroides]
MKVLVGLSGGVDSAVAAYLLKEQGYDVTCCFMRNWDSYANGDIAGNPTIQDDTCPQEQDYQDAKAVAEHLNLPLQRVDFIKEYWDYVFKTFLSEYEKGRTPNPDILCNKYIKFDAFFDYAMKQGFDMVATGHYCSNMTEDSFTYLTRAADTNKDQTYFLCQVSPAALHKTLFPLGKLTKPEVREIAAKLNLESVATKKDSTGICFIGERNFRQFLSNYLPSQDGNIVDVDTGKVVGRHVGVLYYTIGQRKGLNIDHEKGPWFVIGKDVQKNILFVCHHTHKEWLYSDSCLVKGINWIVKDKNEIPEKCTCKFRYRQPDQDIYLKVLDETTALVRYPQKIASVTIGQEAVFYDGFKCIGGGVIEEVYVDGQDLNGKILSTYQERING